MRLTKKNIQELDFRVGLDMSEPVYRIQRIASCEASNQQVLNVLRRLIGLPIKRTSRQAEIDELAKYGLEPEFATFCRWL